jgi:alkylation response protein AidB-like acyl-CoA dehydrogenase
MDISLTQEQAAFQQRFRDWLDAALKAHGPAPLQEAEAFAHEERWERLLHSGGWSGIAWPREYGGRGLGIVEHYLVMEALGAAMAPEGVNNIGRELVGPIILAAGTEQQKLRFLPEIVSCSEIWCQGFSEPGSGSDLASVSTRATRNADGWRINGQKVWTSYAQYSQWCILLARTDPDAPKHKGLTLFLVPMNTPGLECRPIRQITGKQTFCEVFLKDVEIADGCRLGPVNEGWQVANRVLAFERGTTRLYRQARFASELQDMIRLLGDSATPGVIGRLHARLEVLRAHNLRIVSQVAAGFAIGPEASLQKLSWSELHIDMMREAQDMAGPAFLADDSWKPYRHAYLQSQAETIYAGSTEVQLSIIADRVLDLPRPASGKPA